MGEEVEVGLTVGVREAIEGKVIADEARFD
jgi:hypothetical protein